MKKRVKSLFAILVAFSIAFSSLPILTGGLEAHAASKAAKNISLNATASGQSGASLSWNKIKKPEKGYAVFRDGTPIAHLGKKAVSFSDRGLSAGSTHTYQIRTYKTKKTKQWFNKATGKWQKKKPAKKYRGKSRKITTYSYKKKSNAVSIRTASPPPPPVVYYTITWKNWNGAVLRTDSVRQGTTPSYGGTPTRPADTTSTYTFSGWSPSVTAANGNATYTAQYTAKAKQRYLIRWKNWNGSTMDSGYFYEGETPKYYGSTPVRPDDDEYTYTFSGWSPAVTPVQGAVNYTAQYTKKQKGLSPLGYTYKIHFITEPYSNGGSTAIYVETNNPNAYNYTLGVLDSRNNEVNINVSQGYYTVKATSTVYEDVDLSKMHGYIALCSPKCTGNCTFIVRESSDNQETIVATKQATVKDFKVEEQAWMQSVINQVTTPSMGNIERMQAICDYILDNFTYPWVTNDDRFLYLLQEEAVPYWITQKANSSSSPAILVKFGELLDYPLINMYPVYEYGTTQWNNYHWFAYSEADNKYYGACPSTTTGRIDPSTIEKIDPATYAFWGE